MVSENLVSAAIAGVAGGIPVGWIAKLLLTNLLAKHNELATALNGFAVQFAEMKVTVQSFQRTEDMARTHDSRLTALQHQFETLQRQTSEIKLQAGH